MKLALIVNLFVCFLFSANSLAATIKQVEIELLGEIKQARQHYQSQYENITTQRNKLLAQLAKQERELKELSVEAKLVTRIKDEQNISVEKLETRLQSWQQQQNYLQHLLTDIDGLKPINTLEQLKERIQEQSTETILLPTKVALENGQLVQGNRLSLGPVHVFINNDNSMAGLIKQIDEQWQLALTYDEEQRSQLMQVIEHNQGILAVDATNSRSLMLSQHEESISQHLNKGGIWGIPILCFALLAFSIALVKGISLLRLPRLNLTPLSVTNLGLYQQNLLAIAQRYPLQEQQQKRDDLLFDELQQTKRSIERGLSAIAVTAAVAPLLGLLGTVSGMIKTFKLMTLFGAGDANAVSGGISESLVTTEVGLIVAIPALVAHALMSRKCYHYMAKLEGYAVRLSHQNTSPQANVDNTAASNVQEVNNVA